MPQKVEINVTALVIIIFLILLAVLFYLFCRNNTDLLKTAESTQTVEDAVQLVSNIIQNVAETCPAATTDTTSGAKISYETCPQLAMILAAIEKSYIGTDESKYFFILDLAGNMLVNGGNQALSHVNNVRPAQNLAAIPAIKDVITKATTGGGYVKYAWPKPNSKVHEQKEAFVRLVPGTKLIVGSGLYKK